MFAAKLILGIYTLTFSIGGISQTAVGISQVNIQTHINVAQQQSMDFGIILPDPNGDEVTISETQMIESASGNSYFFGTKHYTRFLITGDPNEIVTISIPQTTQITGPGTAMQIKDFHFNLYQEQIRTLDVNGRHEVGYGSTLVINPDQMPGNYSGSYNIIVNSQ